MATIVTTGLYDFDPKMTNSANYIKTERQTLQTPGRDDYFFIIPHAAPFFLTDFKIYNDSTNLPYVEGVDYEIGHYFVEAMQSIDRPVAGSIRFMKTTISGIVRIEYRTLGGNWGFNDAAILAELSNKANNPLIRSWGMIAELPYSFPVVDHDQSVDSIVGSTELQAAIEGIASVLEASAEGATQSHLEDFNNPHKVTKAQVELPDVPAWGIATEAQAKAGSVQTGFMNPYLVSLAITALALAPLNAHIANTDNPHKVDANDIGLNLVANYAPASRDEAIDPTINNRYMTPYTVSLLMASQSSEGQFAALQKLIQDHINDSNNPHEVTPAQIGTYTSEEIDHLLTTVSAADTPRFDGQTADEWRATLPSFDDITTLVNRVGTEFSAGNVKAVALIADDPRSEADLEAIAAAQLANAQAGYNGYYLYGSNDIATIVNAAEVLGAPSQIIAGPDSIVHLPNATYWLDVNGAINATGSAALVIPAAYKAGSGFVAANAMQSIYATKTSVYVVSQAGRLVRITGGVASDLQTTGAWGVTANTEYLNAGEMAAQELSDGSYVAVGSAAWVSAFNTVKQSLNSAISSMVIGDDKVVMILEDSTVRVYGISRTSGVTLTLQTNPTGIPSSPKWVSGSYRHYAIVNDAGAYLLFGDDSQGQLQVDPNAGPFLSVAAGCDFTVTVGQDHRVMFWGDSPDNSLLYKAA